MVTFSPKGTAATRDYGPPSSPQVIGLEDSSTSHTSKQCDGTRHRLPVFLSLNDGSSNSNSYTGGGSPFRIPREKQRPRLSSKAIEQLSTIGRILTEETNSDIERRRVSSIQTLCGGKCNGVTCMISTSITETPCLKFEEPKPKLGDANLDQWQISNLGQDCPYHHLPFMWLVPRCSFDIYQHFLLLIDQVSFFLME